MIKRKAPGLMELLLAAAREIGADVAAAAEELVSAKFNSDVLSEAISGKSIDRNEADLPALIGCAELDGIPVLFGELNGPPVKSNVDAQMRKYRNQAAIARSWLGANAPNLQLFLILRAQAITDSCWKQWAAEIEADDRACRKLVWLFDGSPAISGATAFLERTFVARPWPSEQRAELLDGMANFSMPPGWEEVVEEPGLEYDDLVERLIALEGSAA